MGEQGKASQVFGRLSITFQAQLCLIICYVILCFILIIITFYQLDWLRSEVINGAEDYLEDNLRRQLRAEITVKSSYISQVLSNSEELLDSMTAFEQVLIEGEKFEPSNLLQDYLIEQGTFDYGQTASMRQTDFDSEDEDYESRLSPLASLFTSMYSDTFLYYQTGFTGQGNLIFPGFNLGDRDYEYQLRQWFYNASSSKAVLTQPHFDEFFQDVKTFSLSKTPEKGNKVAFQVKLKLSKLFDEVFYSYSQKHKPHYMIVTKEGFIMGISEDWEGRTDKIMKVFNETIGISQNDWKNIKGKDDNEEIWSFTRPDNPYSVKNPDTGTSYFLMKNTIEASSSVFYLLLSYRYDDVDEEVDDIRDNFGDTFNTIFYIILIIGIITVISIFIVIRLAIRDLITKFIHFEDILGKIFSRALYKDSAQSVDLSGIQQKPGLFKDLISAFECRINNLKLREQQNSDLFLKKIKTPETYLYQEWRSFQYPKSQISRSEVDWVDSLKLLKKHKDYY